MEGIEASRQPIAREQAAHEGDTLTFTDIPRASFTENELGTLAILGFDYAARIQADSLLELVEAFRIAEIPISVETKSSSSWISFNELSLDLAKKLPNERAFGIEVATQHEPDYLPIVRGRNYLRPLFDLKAATPHELLPVIGKLSDYMAAELWYRADTGEPLYKTPGQFVLTQSAATSDKLYTFGFDDRTGGIRLSTASINSLPRNIVLSPLIMPNQGRYEGASIYPLGPYS